MEKAGLGLTAAVVALTLGLVGCKRETPADKPSPPKPVQRDPMAGAPEDFAELLTWAGKKLQADGPRVEIPPPAPVPQRWPVIRLDDLADAGRVHVESAWQAPSGAPGALLELGPFRSDQPQPPRFAVRPVAKTTAEGRDGLELSVSGLDVACNQIGAIELELRVPYGRHVALRWKKAGVILIPVESRSKPFSVQVLTDDFAEWTGKLGQLRLVTDGRGAGVVELRKLRLLPRQNAYPQASGVKRVRLGHEIRTAIYAHAPTTLRFGGLKLPARARLHLGLGLVSPTPDGSATLLVSARTADGQTIEVGSHRIEQAETWRDWSVMLSDHGLGGKQVELELRISSGQPGVVAFLGNPAIYEPMDEPPILIVYLIDTLAAEHMRLYGYRRDTTPNLDRLAAGGVLLTQAFANSSRTVESIPDMMLGLYTERHGVRHNSTPAADRLVTLAETLRAAGMATVSYCTNVNAGPRQGMDQGFDTFVDKIGYYWTRTDRTVPIDEVLYWLDEHADRPMFLYIHTAEPHAPYTPPKGFAGRFDPQYTGRIDGTYDRRHGFRTIRNPRAQMRDLQHVIALYDEEILYADHRFGLFWQALEQRGVRRRVHLFVTADHGEEFLQHGMWEHGTDLHGEQTRVPLIAWGPGFASGAKVDAPVQLVDLMPTILDLYELPPPYPLDGDSFLPLLRPGGPAAEASGRFARRLIVGSNHNYRISHGFIEYYLIAEGRWKLLYGWTTAPLYQGGPRTHFRLYDLRNDRIERRNLLHEQSEKARELIGELLRWHARQRLFDAERRGPTQIESKHMRELMQLGYLGGVDDEDEPNEAQPPATSQPLPAQSAPIETTRPARQPD